jgi:hypothetical protein
MQRIRLGPVVLLTLFLSSGAAGTAGADEGMWTFDDFPKAKVKAAYGFEPTDAWLTHVMRASARIAGGCSASFVSGTGLVLTNHHCARSCIQQLSTPERDFIATGFLARARTDELRCPEMEINQLVEISDVTGTVKDALRGKAGEPYHEARKGVQARLEKACQTTDTLRCDLVDLYRGGQFKLYKYRRYQDTRLVFAPEMIVAFFGGDPDNVTIFGESGGAAKISAGMRMFFMGVP